jgi:hypothetical protein
VTELSQLLAAKAGFASEKYPITLDEAITLYRDLLRGDA